MKFENITIYELRSPWEECTKKWVGDHKPKITKNWSDGNLSHLLFLVLSGKSDIHILILITTFHSQMSLYGIHSQKN